MGQLDPWTTDSCSQTPVCPAPRTPYCCCLLFCRTTESTPVPPTTISWRRTKRSRPRPRLAMWSFVITRAMAVRIPLPRSDLWGLWRNTGRNIHGPSQPTALFFLHVSRKNQRRRKRRKGWIRRNSGPRKYQMTAPTLELPRNLSSYPLRFSSTTMRRGRSATTMSSRP